MFTRSRGPSLALALALCVPWTPGMAAAPRGSPKSPLPAMRPLPVKAPCDLAPSIAVFARVPVPDGATVDRGRRGSGR